MAPKVTYPDGSTPKICIVGAGFSGLCAAIQLKKQLGLTSFTIFEALHDVGGTWLANTYPGCACDVQSHLYSFSFEKNPNWTQTYSSQPEIWQYVKRVANKYNLYPKIKFNTKVKSLTWEEDIKKWRVVTASNSNEESEQESLFDIVINGPGALREPKYPEEFKSFKGPTTHSGEWNSEIDLRDKVVGVIGSGASAIQIIPSIAKDVKELHAFQRKVPYVEDRNQFNIPEFIQTLFTYIPLLMLLYRAFIYLTAELLVLAFKSKSFLNKLAQKKSLKQIAKLVTDEKIQKELTPSFRFGCKRVMVHESYYNSFNLSHVKLHTSKITKVSDDSITTEDGKSTKLDVLILCTGFKVQDFFAPMEIIGKDGINIYDLWQKETPRTYYGTTAHAMPNHFILLGPNTALGHNSVAFMIECQVNFTIQIIREMIRRNANKAQVKLFAQDQFMDFIRTEMKNTIWGVESCGSWYANDRGEITTLWPESCTSYWLKTRNVNFSHFNFE